jgi:hypothetical protein
MIRPTVKEIYNYNDMEKHINEKFHVYINDFAGRYHLPGDAKAPDWFLEWTMKEHGVKDMEDLSQIQKNDMPRYSKMFADYRDNHEKNEPPYQNFWHFILDDVFGEIDNGENMGVDFVEIKESFATEDWQRKILDMFIEEFGSKLVHVEFSW